MAYIVLFDTVLFGWNKVEFAAGLEVYHPLVYHNMLVKCTYREGVSAF